MFTTLLCLTAIVSADPLPDRAAILKTFRREFVEITPGTGKFPPRFQMGRREGGFDRERPVRVVTMSRPFAVAKYEVPQNLWHAVMGNNPSRWQGPRNSVEMISLPDALQFCSKATELMRTAGLIGDAQTIRLPSEAEWEYVARAGSDTIYSFGDGPEQLGRYAWFTGNAAGNDPPVGAKQPNAWGLYDLHGYLWEWCLDTAHEDYRGAPTDATAWTAGGDPTRHVLRGGSWKDPAQRLTSTYRRFAAADTRDDAVGLRCVLADR